MLSDIFCLKSRKSRVRENVFITPASRILRKRWTNGQVISDFFYETRAGYLSNVLLHALIISILYIIKETARRFRCQILLFDEESIQDIGAAQETESQTVIALVCIFTFTMVIVFSFPYDLLSELHRHHQRDRRILFFHSNVEKNRNLCVDLDIQEQEEMGEIADISAGRPVDHHPCCSAYNPPPYRNHIHHHQDAQFSYQEHAEDN